MFRRIFGTADDFSKQPICGTWEVTTIAMTGGDGKMRIADRVQGTIRVDPDGTIAEQVKFEMGSNTIQWQASGTVRMSGQHLNMQVNSHTMAGYVGKELNRRLDFQPETNFRRAALYLPLLDGGRFLGSFTLGLKRIS